MQKQPCHRLGKIPLKIKRAGLCANARYEDDLDEGEWFLYTGSGGRDLSGNKRVNKIQSFDQTFDKMNKALLISCEKGLPVRVVRSHKVCLLRSPSLYASATKHA